MALNTGERQDIVYFTGIEVEHTAAYGMFTLFVVGTPPLAEILEKAAIASASMNKVEQIYFGTSQSFDPKTFEDWSRWNELIKGCLDAGYWVTLDFDVKYAESIHEEGWNEYNRFIPMISVKLPYIGLYNYNATVKIDDRTWGATNPGVWTHPLHSLMDRKCYTHWDQYESDKPIL
jgi:hypothetical protein